MGARGRALRAAGLIAAVLALAAGVRAALYPPPPCDPCGGAAPVCGYQDGTSSCAACDPGRREDCYGGYCLAGGACAGCGRGGCVQCLRDLDCPFQMFCGGGVCACNGTAGCVYGLGGVRGVCYNGLCYYD